jgi:peroxiredoxin
MLDLGTRAPVFRLKNVTSGQWLDLEEVRDHEALLIVFLCAHCPYVEHVAPELVRLFHDYTQKRVAMIGITANDPKQYPADAPDKTAETAARWGISFPILFDETQEIAIAYRAACTPDFFLFDRDNRLVYRGQLDSSRPSRGADRPGVGELNGADLRAALDAVLDGRPVDSRQKLSIGCNIKWKPGNAPGYFAL